MADDDIPIEGQKINFSIGADSGSLHEDLKKADKAVDASAEVHKKAARTVSEHWTKSAEHQHKAVGSISKAHEKMAKSGVLPKITAPNAPPRFTNLVSGGGGAAPGVPPRFTNLVSGGGGVAQLPTGPIAKGHVKRGEFDPDATPITPKTFETVEKKAVEMQKGLSEAFKKSTIDGLSFTEANKLQIDSLIKKYQFFGKEVPRALEDASKGLDRYEKKLETMAQKQKGVFWSLENFIERVRGVDIKATAIGAAAFALATKLPKEFEKAYKVGSDGAKTMAMSEEQVYQRARDTLGVMIATGGKMEDIAGISKGWSTAAVTPFEGQFKEAAIAAEKLHKATGLDTEAAGRLTSVMQKYYGMTGDALDEMVSKSALFSKNSLLSIQQQVELYDQLKFVGFGLSANAKGAGAIAESTVKAAAQMSIYGIKVDSVVKNITDLTEGGVEEQQKGLMGLILGGKTPEEAMQILTDLQSENEKVVRNATDEIQKARKTGAGVLYGMAGESPFARAQARTVGGDIFGYGRGEVGKYAAANTGLLAGTPGAKAMEAAGPKDLAAAMEEFLTASEKVSEAENKLGAATALTMESVYRAADAVAEKLNKVAGSLGNFIEKMDSGTRNLVGTLSEIAMIGIGLKSILPQISTLTGMFSGGKGAAGELAGAGRGAFPVLGQAAEGGMTRSVGSVFLKWLGPVGLGVTLGLIFKGFVDSMAERVGKKADLYDEKTKGTQNEYLEKRAAKYEAEGKVVEAAKLRETIKKTNLPKSEGGSATAPTSEFKSENQYEVTGEMANVRGEETPVKTIEQLKKERTAKWAKKAETATTPPVTTAETVTASPVATAETATTPPVTTAETVTASPVATAKTATGIVISTAYKDIEKAGAEKGLKASFDTGGRHTKGSKHSVGGAADFSLVKNASLNTPAGWGEAKANFEAHGYKVVDERKRPPGEKEWTGPHMHTEVKESLAELKKGTKQEVSATTLAAARAKTEPEGKTEGEEGIIAELKRTNAMMAQQLAILQKGKNLPLPFSREGEAVNRAGLGG